MKRSILLIVFLLAVLSGMAQSVGGTTSGAATYCTTTNSGFVSVAGFVGNILFWQTSTNGGATWTNNANTTANQTYFNLAQTTCFRAVVQDGAFPADTSTIVCIDVFPPSVGGTVSGGGTFCDNSGAGALTLSGNNGGVLYWLSSTDGGATWNTIANTTTTYNYTGITQTTIFQAVVQNGASCPTDTSTQVLFTIDPLSVAGTINGATSVCATGNSGSLTLSGTTGTIIDWISSVNSGASWTSTGNTSSTQAFNNLTQTTWYQVIVQSGSCAPDTSAVAIITVNPASVAGTLTGGGIYCGVPATGILTLAGTTGTIINWFSSTNNGASWTPIANTTNTETYTNLPTTTWYSVLVQSAGCPPDTSNIEIVSVAPQTVAGTVASNASVCYFLNNDTLNLSGNVGNVLYWLSSTDNGATWTPVTNTTASLIYAGLTQSTWYTAVVQSGACNIDTTAAVAVTVLAPTPVSAGADTTIVQGQSVTLNGSGTGVPLWVPSAGLSSATIFTPVATPNTTTAYILTVTDVNNCINADTVLVIVTVLEYNGMISNLFTPNGDGINDTWYLQDIANYPDNEVTVYNIYGNVVFQKQGYTNDWKGTYNGSELPDGTYYYVLKFDSSDKVLKGSIDILRNK
ncbi:MAG: gliding motility-associated C-terminal domain-containing protein [Bacteroidia bacterium]|nr:gliding motility-associated C-terminal domain-containing protein [Bacteroidia bacterium]